MLKGHFAIDPIFQTVKDEICLVERSQQSFIVIQSGDEIRVSRFVEDDLR
ncbi:MAG: hypothetical protein R6U57_12765 [Anaerolineales bacterium]